MVIDRLIHGTGTSEAAWLACPALQILPVEPVDALVPADSRVVVCAPHPDDEILPCAGLLAAASDLGRTICVLALTDGEGSHGCHSRITPEILREIRPLETGEAFRRLEVPAVVERLRLPDGKLTDLEAALAEEFVRRFRPGDVVITPWRLDGHPDHEATTRAVRQASDRTGCAVWETPIWGWHWSRPADTPMPWEVGVRFALNATQLRRKVAAIHAFESQLISTEESPPILTASTLARFIRPWEIYFR